MPKGAKNFVKSNERAKAKQSQKIDIPKIDYFSIGDGQKAVVRFLEQGQDDLIWGVSHRVRVPGTTFYQDVICLDQEDEGTPCPLCQSDDLSIRKRSTKGYVNVIWRGNEDIAELNQKLKANGEKPYTLAPVYQRDKWGKPEKNQTGQKIITGFGDQVFLWKCSKTIFQILLSKDTKYKGLSTRDFEVSREGAGMEDTKYFIEPFDVDSGAVPMTTGDELLAQKKYNVEAFTTPSDYASVAAMISEESAANETTPGVEPATDEVFPQGQPVVRSSAFGV